MKTIRPLLLSFLSASALFLGNGCATLPNVSEKIAEAPVKDEHPQIVSAKGDVSPQKSKAIMEGLKESVAPTDMLSRDVAVVESVTGSPMTKGNKVTLLNDGPAAYGAMFKAIQDAKNNYQPRNLHHRRRRNRTQIFPTRLSKNRRRESR